MPRPTFAQLEQILLSLGFVRVPVTGTHIFFDHPEAKTNLAFRPYQPDDRVDPSGLLVVRHTLDAWGLLSARDFERQLEELPVAG